MSRLIIGAGIHHEHQDGDVTLDILSAEGIDVVHDANLDWPFEDNTFDEVIAIHVVEHLNSMMHFMNESWRVLNEGGELYIETPLAGANAELEFADPTHVRCYTPYTFHNYFTLRGIKEFGYTDKPWAIIACFTKPAQPLQYTTPDVLVFHGYPIKKKEIHLQYD